MTQGRRLEARGLVMDLLAASPNDIEAWRLAVSLARTDTERRHAEAGLTQALASQQVKPVAQPKATAHRTDIYILLLVIGLLVLFGLMLCALFTAAGIVIVGLLS